MLQVIIDGKTAALPPDFTIGIILNNYILVERKEDATYPLTLSLQANRHIFGFPERLNNNNFPLELPASVMYGPYTLLSGRTVVTDISDTEIELFIATDTKSFWGVNSEKYIDSLDLGRERCDNSSDLKRELDNSLRDYRPYVAVQLYDKNYKSSYKIPNYYNRWDFVEQRLCRKWGVHNNSFSPFMRLVEVVERVITACGYSIRVNDLRKISGFEDIIMIKRYDIGDAASSIQYSYHVPHVTVKEFFDEIERKFSIRFFINEAAKEVHIRSAAVIRSRVAIRVDVLDGVKKTYEDKAEDSEPKNYKFSDKEVPDPNWQRYKTDLSIIIGEDKDTQNVECISTIVASKRVSEVVDPVGHEVQGEYPTNVHVDCNVLEIDTATAETPEFRLAVYRGIHSRGVSGPDKELYGNVPEASPDPIEGADNQMSLLWTGGTGLYKRFHEQRTKGMNFTQTHELLAVPDISILADAQSLLSDNVIVRHQRYIVEEEEIELSNNAITEHKLVAHPL